MLVDTLGRELKIGMTVVTVYSLGSRAEYDCGVVTGFTKTRVKVARFNEYQKRVDTTDRQPDKLLIMEHETFPGTPWEQALMAIRAEVLL